MKEKKPPTWRVLALSLGLAAAALMLAVATAPAQTQSERYFDETGHTVRGPFLVFFDAQGGLEIFGYPITDEFVDSNGRLVQYFQRARFEWHPEAAAGFQVQLGLLGDELNYAQPPLPLNQIPLPNDPRCYYFSETGHAACYAFLDYFRAHGGLEVFGYPTGEAIVESDYVAQNFQRMRMEWRPEKPANQKVQLADLGTIAFNTFKLSEDLRKPQPPANRPLTVTKLNLRASVSLAVTSRAGSQIVYVIATDQLNQPLQGVLVAAVFHFVSGEQTYTLPLTDARGVAQLGIPFGQTKPGDAVTIDVTAVYKNLTSRTRASFLPWW